jgi:hypothetical protein
MKRAAALLAALVAIAVAGPARAAAPEWRSQQPVGPQGRAPLGEVGDLECWQANRCLLITAGNSGMPAGLYAYDGTGWYLYSTVCGGHEGRIAWAGPDDFWTVSDQQAGQETEFTQLLRRPISLCHFKDGAVVASYAEPLGVASSYLPMHAAACLGPEECWFAGERLPGTVNVGAFHLYWNGLSVTSFPPLTESLPELEDPGRSVVGLAYHEGGLYESVRVQGDDEAPGESESEPSFLHRVVPGAPPAFVPEEPAEPLSYGEGAVPSQLEGFRLSDDGEALWAVSGASSAPAEVTALRLGPGASSFAQVSLSGSGSPFVPGDRVTGLAAEPEADAAWVGFRPPTDFGSVPARLALVHADGSVDPPVALPAEGEGVGRYWGSAGPISCPAAGQCWMATQKGWLFHLGPDPAADEDPAMHTLVTFRPPDAGLPSVPPTSLPEDDSGAGSSSQGEEETPLGIQEEPLPRRRPPLVTKLKQSLVDGTTLELRFVLRVKAHVRLLAKRKGAVVAKTPGYTMAKGPRSLRLRLDPKRWPTKLDLQVHAVKGRAK